MSVEIWDQWNSGGGTNYPQEKVVQFCFRNYPARADREQARALDLGCGSGVHTAFLAIEGFRVTGTDRSAMGVENTRRRIRELGLEADLRVEGADVLDFPDSSFDLVLCIGVYDSAGPTVARRSVERLRHVMSPSARGLFLFSSDRDSSLQGENPWRFHGFTRAEVEDLFTGFAQVWIDRYITTYEGGRIEQNEWIVTVRR
jgi:cyclopropane fatty-acyl-phospholipid synthase-like methyltransferase